MRRLGRHAARYNWRKRKPDRRGACPRTSIRASVRRDLRAARDRRRARNGETEIPEVRKREGREGVLSLLCQDVEEELNGCRRPHAADGAPAWVRPPRSVNGALPSRPFYTGCGGMGAPHPRAKSR